ncbi:hypothetical protein H7H48_13725 [Nitratireductor sp. B36]|uniref:COG3904 family protein n=1 Tax=Nitratireductor sp. B36 TaxID=2762059 RepID=UPI001E342413|nr:hypothetical protein [Nitratireductor sp. B36]MCC5780117.1 hypothetical protein [Nitratireductor sp. B36]
MTNHLAASVDRTFPKRRALAPLDGSVLRAAVVGAALGAAVVLGMELRELTDRQGGLQASLRMALDYAAQRVQLVVGAENRHPLWQSPAEDVAPPRTPVSSSASSLTFTIGRNGVLSLQGVIQPGSASRLRDVLNAPAAPITTITLDSPGGALNDAMAMARLIRQHGLSTSVRANATCASSCPLILAGGTQRHVSRDATIAVHQFHSPGSLADPRQALSDAQLVTARISRHLDEMGVDPALWLHALDTPPRSLYVLSPEQMRAYRLVTDTRSLALN